MIHPFKDKLVVFIGRPQHCKRKDARDALVRVGGIPDEQITAFIDFAVAFDGAEKTKAYQKAIKYSSLLSILTEMQFFDILDGKTMPPNNPIHDNSVIVIHSADKDSTTRELEEARENICNRKRINNLARHGIPTSDGRVKIDMRPLNTMVNASKAIREQKNKRYQ